MNKQLNIKWTSTKRQQHYNTTTRRQKTDHMRDTR